MFFSPYSISTVLAMTYAGARGNTEKEMAATLRFTLNRTQLHPAFDALETRWKKVTQEGGIRVHVANSLWPQKDHPFLDGHDRIIAQGDGGYSKTGG